jgi:hypothetical protein
MPSSVIVASRGGGSGVGADRGTVFSFKRHGPLVFIRSAGRLRADYIAGSPGKTAVGRLGDLVAYREAARPGGRRKAGFDLTQGYVSAFFAAAKKATKESG